MAKSPKRLKAYAFDISPQAYGDGVVVVTAYNIKQAKSMAAAYTGRAVESLVNYTVIDLDEPRVVAYAYHAS